MWTEATVDLLAQRWNVDGVSSSAIGRELGITRSAVCGKIKRLREAGYAFVAREHYRARPAQPRNSELRTRERMAPKPKTKTPAPSRPPRAVRSTGAPLPEPRHVSIYLINGLRECTAISRESTRDHEAACCGHAAVPGTAWCRPHLERVYPKTIGRDVHWTPFGLALAPKMRTRGATR